VHLAVSAGRDEVEQQLVRVVDLRRKFCKAPELLPPTISALSVAAQRGRQGALADIRRRNRRADSARRRGTLRMPRGAA
jgi:hypothetical protein